MKTAISLQQSGAETTRFAERLAPADPGQLAHLLGTPAAAATRRREPAGPVAAQPSPPT